MANFPMTNERYTQIKAKMRRQWKTIQKLENRLEKRMLFNIGDRVRVYDVDQTNGRKVFDKGTITWIAEDSGLYIATDFWQAAWYHPIQCIKLKKKLENKEYGLSLSLPLG